MSTANRDRRVGLLPRRYADDSRPAPARRPRPLATPAAAAPTPEPAVEPAVEEAPGSAGVTLDALEVIIDAARRAGLPAGAELLAQTDPDGPLRPVLLLRLRPPVEVASEPANQLVITGSNLESTEDAVARGLREMRERQARMSPKRPGPTAW